MLDLEEELMCVQSYQDGDQTYRNEKESIPTLVTTTDFRNPGNPTPAQTP